MCEYADHRAIPLPCHDRDSSECEIHPLRLGGACVARKPNFGFEKRQKDIKKQQKREEKAEKKRLRALAGLAEEPADGPEEGDEDEGEPRENG